jgi:hypothetical protein
MAWTLMRATVITSLKKSHEEETPCHRSRLIILPL